MGDDEALFTFDAQVGTDICRPCEGERRGARDIGSPGQGGVGRGLSYVNHVRIMTNPRVSCQVALTSGWSTRQD